MKTLITLLAACMLCMGCATGKQSPPQIEINENLTLRAEQVIASSWAVCDAFVMWEYANRSALPQRVTDIADEIRGKTGLWLNARSFLRSYKAGNLANAGSLMAMINELELLGQTATNTLTEAR